MDLYLHAEFYRNRRNFRGRTDVHTDGRTAPSLKSRDTKLGGSVRGSLAVGHWTCDLQVAGSISGRSAFT